MANFKYDASEIRCGGLDIKTYIDKKVSNLFQRTFQFMPYTTFATFNDCEKQTATNASTYYQIPLDANAWSSDDNILSIDTDNNFIKYDGNTSQRLHLTINLSASVDSLSEVTRFMVRLQRIDSNGNIIKTSYRQNQFTFTYDQKSLQWNVSIDYEGGIEKGDYLRLDWQSSVAGVKNTWSKMSLYGVVKPVIQSDLLESSL